MPLTKTVEKMFSKNKVLYPPQIRGFQRKQREGQVYILTCLTLLWQLSLLSQHRLYIFATLPTMRNMLSLIIFCKSKKSQLQKQLFQKLSKLNLSRSVHTVH